MAPAPTLSPPAFDVAKIRRDFPILASRVNGHPLIYLDNAATTQKPLAVIRATDDYYRAHNANIHRGVHTLSQDATRLYEAARDDIAAFIGTPDRGEIILTRGTTEGINLVAHSYARPRLKPGDEVVISAMEHHSNIVPWQIACEMTGATLRVLPMDDRGQLRMDEIPRVISPRTKIVAVVHLSNSLGTINDVAAIIARAREVGAAVLVDGAQWVCHHPTDVRTLGADFYVFSAHKLCGPTGVGVLWGRRELLEAMPPYQGGGDMIANVTFAKTTYAGLPNKFEAGTPDIAGGVGLGAAVKYIQSVGLDAIAAHEAALLRRATALAEDFPGLRIIGTAANKASVLSFLLDGAGAQDVGTMLDLQGIAVRTGHHCCQPVMDAFGIPGTARASFAFYNTHDEVDALFAALAQVRQTLATRSARVAVAAVEPDAWPTASAPSPSAAADEIAEVFEFLGEWKDRYEHLIELGEKLPAFPESARTEANKVKGCQSTVHMIARVMPNSPGVIQILADSDAQIVRGLIALLQKLFSGQPAPAIAAFDVTAFFKRLGLDQHLSMGRRNGLEGMVRRIMDFARASA